MSIYIFLIPALYEVYRTIKGLKMVNDKAGSYCYFGELADANLIFNMVV
jgi:hypothetical protein